jgi:transcriptional regulator with XRE-family HTH domain
MTLDEHMTAGRITDAKLASLVGVSRPFITKLRQGKATPSLPVAAKIQEITGVPAVSLIRNDEDAC